MSGASDASFDGRTVVITGAGGNLGRAVVATFLDRGANVVSFDRDGAPRPDASSTADASRTLSLAVDLLGERDALERACAAVIDHFGRIDALCHLVGGFRMGEAVHETGDATFDFLVDLNARAFVNVARVVVPHLVARRAGRIVAVAATAGLAGGARMGAYAASKSMLMRLVESMSAELGEHGINVNCVLPSIIDTPENRAAMPEADVARWVAPDALADAIAFLASDAARAVHGVALPVTGLG